MGYDRGRRGRGRDKRDGFGEEGFDPFADGGAPASAVMTGAAAAGTASAAEAAAVSRRLRRRQSRRRLRRRRPRSARARWWWWHAAQVVGTGQGKVKFFNAQKGFGFIQRDEGGEDVFVHISQVERAGLEGLAEGQELQFNLVDRGGKISAADLQVVGDVIKVEQRNTSPQRELTGEKATGTVKFFNSMKGFGFITRDDGKEDAFVHISAVERSGLSNINEGDRFEFDLEVDRRGKFSAVNLVPRSGLTREDRGAGRLTGPIPDHKRMQ
jgi:CspA family cold shock protein